MVSAFHAGSDRPHCQASGESEAARANWVLAAAITASSLGFLDGSIVNVALPALDKGLRGNSMDLQWTINGYLLPLAALLLIGGAAGDNFGRRRLLMAGLVVFALASIGCAASPSFGVLVPMRALQGIGGAMLMPNSLALIGATFSGAARGQAIGTWAAAGVGASAIGPPLGGWLIGAFGWQAIFLVNVPVALAALWIAWRHVPEIADSGRRLDWAGAALATVGLALFVWPITHWSATMSVLPVEWLIIGVGLATFAGFVALERRRGDDAMMPVAMFGSPAFGGLTLITFLIYGALGGLFVLFPYVLIKGGYTPLQAGLGLLPFSLITGIAARPMGRLAAKIGPRWPLVGGSLTGAVGYLLLTRLDPGGSYWLTVVPGAALVALGTAAVVAPLTTAVLGCVDAKHSGTASGFNSAISRTGSLIATAFAGAVLVKSDAALTTGFHAAAVVGAALAAVAAVTAFVSLASKPAA